MDKNLFNRALQLWDLYNTPYRDLPLEYARLNNLRKERKKKVRGLLSRRELKAYPRIYILEITIREEVEYVLTGLRDEDIRLIIAQIEDLEYNHSFVAMRNSVVCLKYVLRHSNEDGLHRLGLVDPDLKNRSHAVCHRTTRGN